MWARFAFALMLSAAGGLAAGGPAAAQESVTVRGRVVDAVSGSNLSGITVELEGRAPVITANDGTFRIVLVQPGRYTLSVIGLGYARQQQQVDIVSDTTLVIGLERAPVALDTLSILARTIQIRGRVKDKAIGRGLMDVDVYATPPDRHVTTDGGGGFRLERMPANAPVTVHVRELGYLWPTVTVEAERDTTIEFELEPDPVAMAVIAEQKQKIEERAGEWRYPWDSVIDREELLRSGNGSVRDVLDRIVGKARMARVRCVIINERESRAYLLPGIRADQVEYIDVLRFGSGRNSLMIRIYTREFMAHLIGGYDLVPLEHIVTSARVGNCR